MEGARLAAAAEASARAARSAAEAMLGYDDGRPMEGVKTVVQATVRPASEAMSIPDDGEPMDGYPASAAAVEVRVAETMSAAAAVTSGLLAALAEVNLLPWLASINNSRGTGGSALRLRKPLQCQVVVGGEDMALLLRSDGELEMVPADEVGASTAEEEEEEGGINPFADGAGSTAIASMADGASLSLLPDRLQGSAMTGPASASSSLCCALMSAGDRHTLRGAAHRLQGMFSQQLHPMAEALARPAAVTQFALAAPSRCCSLVASSAERRVGDRRRLAGAVIQRAPVSPSRCCSLVARSATGRVGDRRRPTVAAVIQRFGARQGRKLLRL